MPKITFEETEIKNRIQITRPLKKTERKDGRINVGCSTLKDYVDGEDIIEVIIRKRR